MRAATRTVNDRRLEPANAPDESVRAERLEVRLRFGSEAASSRYLRALTSLLFGASTKITATLTTGAPREDLDADEIADRIARNAIEKLGFSFLGNL